MKQILGSQIAAAGLADFDVLVAAHASEMRAWRAHMARVAEDEAADPPVPEAKRHVAHPPPAAHPLVAEAIDADGWPDFEVVDDGPTPAQVLAAKKARLLGMVTTAELAAKARIVPPGKRRLFAMREDAIRAADAQRSREIAEEHRAAAEATQEAHSAALTEYADGIRQALAAHAERLTEHADKVVRDLAEHAEKLAEHKRSNPEPGLLTKAAIAVGLKDEPPLVLPPEQPLPPPPPAFDPPGPAPEPPDIPPPPDIPDLIRAARPAEDTRHLEEQQLRREKFAAIERAAAQAHHDVEDLTADEVDGWQVPDFS